MAEQGAIQEKRNEPLLTSGRRVIKVLDDRYVIPGCLDPIRILQTMQVANNDGGTGWHYEFVTLCEEVDGEADRG